MQTLAGPARSPVPPAEAEKGRRPAGVRSWLPWLFIAPNLLGLIAFTLGPMLAGLGIAFTRWNVLSGLDGIEWVGLDNFADLFADPKFWHALGRTVFFAGLGVPLSIAFGLLLALALNRPLVGRAALRVVFFVPSMVNTVAIGMVWLLVLNPGAGLLNQALRLLGLSEPPTWLVSEDWALPALVLIQVWAGVGYQAVIYLAALQELPQDLHEAAMIDGAGAWRRFRTITWPSLMPTTTFLAITSFISTSQGFGLIAFLTGGGPGESTTVLAYYMYQSGFQAYKFGYAAAIGVVTFAAVLLLTLLLWRFQKGRGLYT